VFQGDISGTTLTIHSITSNHLNPGVVPGIMIMDETGSLARSTIIRSQLSGTTGGVGTYAVYPSQTVSLEEMAAVVSGFESRNNASFVTWKDLQATRMTGDGMSLIADGSKAGGQGGTGDAIRQIIPGGYFTNNQGAGIRFDQIVGGAVTDLALSAGNIS